MARRLIGRMGIGGMAVAALALGACQAKQADDVPATANAGETAGVTRQETAAPAPAPVTAPAAVIQTQQGSRGNTVQLNRAAVTGDILTVSLTFIGSGDCCVRLNLDDVSVIDDATAQRISVLKDNSGKYMAAPLESNGKAVTPESFQGASVVWFKFPAPPATSRTISIAIPGVAPFDAVPVTR